MRRLGRFVAAGLIALAMTQTPRPAAAQLIVFDPNNYAQNVLAAARALQQINNQITSLQNQAQMLVNQAKNLALLLDVCHAVNLEPAYNATNSLFVMQEKTNATANLNMK